MNISVVVVCYNEERKIQACLESLISQKYDKGLLEILVIDNNSTDNTLGIVQPYCSGNLGIPIFLHVNPLRGIAISRNVGVSLAKYSFIAFLDADCVAPPHWLEKLAGGFERHDTGSLVAVGGGNMPPDSTIFYRSLSCMLNSYLGSHGSVQGMRYEKDREVSHLPCANVLYRKDLLRSFGGFDEKMVNICEDTELSFRLSEKGYHLYYLADCVVIHHMRSTFSSWTCNIFTYGKGRMWVIQKHPAMLSVKFFVPVFFVLSLIVSLLFSPWYPNLLFIPAAYLLSMLLYSFMRSLKYRSIQLFGHLFVLYVLTHTSFGLGEIYGIFKKHY